MKGHDAYVYLVRESFVDESYDFIKLLEYLCVAKTQYF